MRNVRLAPHGSRLDLLGRLLVELKPANERHPDLGFWGYLTETQEPLSSYARSAKTLACETMMRVSISLAPSEPKARRICLRACLCVTLLLFLYVTFVKCVSVSVCVLACLCDCVVLRLFFCVLVCDC